MYESEDSRSLQNVKNLTACLVHFPIEYCGTSERSENVRSTKRNSTKFFLAKWTAIIPPIERPWTPIFPLGGILYFTYAATISESSLSFYNILIKIIIYLWTWVSLAKPVPSVVPNKHIYAVVKVVIEPVGLILEEFGETSIWVAENHTRKIR